MKAGQHCPPFVRRDLTFSALSDLCQHSFKIGVAAAERPIRPHFGSTTSQKRERKYE
jgi:hypothetical protein